MPQRSRTDSDETGNGRYIHTGSVIGSNNRFDNSYRATNSNNTHMFQAPVPSDTNGEDTTGNMSPDEDGGLAQEEGSARAGNLNGLLVAILSYLATQSAPRNGLLDDTSSSASLKTPAEEIRDLARLLTRPQEKHTMHSRTRARD